MHRSLGPVELRSARHIDAGSSGGIGRGDSNFIRGVGAPRPRRSDVERSGTECNGRPCLMAILQPQPFADRIIQTDSESVIYWGEMLGRDSLLNCFLQGCESERVVQFEARNSRRMRDSAPRRIRDDHAWPLWHLDNSHSLLSAHFASTSTILTSSPPILLGYVAADTAQTRYSMASLFSPFRNTFRYLVGCPNELCATGKEGCKVLTGMMLHFV